MTINELYETIKQKRDNAHRSFEEVKSQGFPMLEGELKGEVNAYNDVLSLLESSGINNIYIDKVDTLIIDKRK